MWEGNVKEHKLRIAFQCTLNGSHLSTHKPHYFQTKLRFYSILTNPKIIFHQLRYVNFLTVTIFLILVAILLMKYCYQDF